ncbi:MAG: tetratricopeptide repeat protein, partial [Pseudomonadota bacterium]
NKISSYEADGRRSSTVQTGKNEPVIVRVSPFEIFNKFGSAMSLAAVTLIVVIPFSMIGFGILKYSNDLESDRVTQSSQALRTLALSGDADAQNKFGWRLSNGVGVPKSRRRANRWYNRAANQGHTKAQYNVGLSYKCNRKKKSACRKAAEWFHKAADKGLTPAQSKLAYLYYKGWGVKKSHAKAFDLFKAAADKNDGYSLYFLGFMYEKGRGVEQSRQKAIRYYQRAIENGYPNAQKGLNRLES